MWLWKFHIPAAGRLSFANRCLVLHHPHPRCLFYYQWLFKSRPVIPFLVCCDSVIVGSVKFVLLKSYESFSSHLEYHNFREKHNSTKWLEDNFPKLGLATFPGTICWLGGMFFFHFSKLWNRLIPNVWTHIHHNSWMICYNSTRSIQIRRTKHSYCIVVYWSTHHLQDIQYYVYIYIYILLSSYHPHGKIW